MGSSLPPGNGGGPHGVGQGRGDDGGCGDPPEDEWGEELPPDESPEQGLFLSVPAGNADLCRFTGDPWVPVIAPGPLLAGLTASVAGSDGAGLAGASDDFVFAVIAAGRRMSSWGTWLELSAMHELALRHPAAPDRPARRTPARPRQPWARQHRVRQHRVGQHRVAYACDLAGRLPVTFAAPGAGLIDPVHAKIIYEQTEILSAADAARADPVLAAGPAGCFDYSRIEIEQNKM